MNDRFNLIVATGYPVFAMLMLYASINVHALQLEDKKFDKGDFEVKTQTSSRMCRSSPQ